MRINNVITKMQAGEKAYGCSLTFPSTAVVELLGQAGLDQQLHDRVKAIALLDESLAISSELGMRPLMERVLSRREILKA